MEDKGRMLIHKDKAGQKWFVGVYSNNFEDREKETFSWDSHLEYTKWIKSTGVKLPVTVMHQPKFPVEVHLAQLLGLASGLFTAKEFSDNYMKMYKPFAIAQTEAVIPINGFMLVVAKILKGKEDTVKLLSKSSWAMSHGFLSLGRDEDTIDQYRSFEFTTLPSVMAANAVTVSSIQEINKMDELKGLSEEDRVLLKEALNADPGEVEQATEAAQEVLKKVLSSKELVEGTEEAEPKEASETPSYEEIREKIFSDFGVESLQKAFNDIAAALHQVEQKMADFDQRIVKTELSEDEKIASQLTSSITWAFDKGDVDVLSSEEKETLREGAVGEKKLDGVEEAQKMQTNDPLAWTTRQMVVGA